MVPVYLTVDHFESGPVAQLWLKDFVPHGLHGCFTPELYGLCS